MDKAVSFSGSGEETSVVGFEAPGLPDSAYNNAYPLNEDEALDLPLVPPQLLHTLLSHPARGNTVVNLPLPQNVILNHLYIENREPPRSVVAMGITQSLSFKVCDGCALQICSKERKRMFLICTLK